MPTPHYGQPRYRVIADELRKRIENGAIPPGTLLPTESTLTAEFKASRGTVRQAITILRDNGLVVTEHGRGTYVMPAEMQSDSLVGASETQSSQRIIAATADLAMVFGVEIGTALIERNTVKRSRGEVQLLTKTYCRPSGPPSLMPKD